MICYFEYGNKEIEYLKARDTRIAECVEKIGHIAVLQVCIYGRLRVAQYPN